MPLTIRAAPGFGIGEIRKDGFKATYAAIKIAIAAKVNNAEMLRRKLASLSRAPAGFRKRSPKSPNWSPTKILAFRIISSRRVC